MADVFISYSRRDTDFVRRLIAGLEAEGKEVWLDLEDIPAGSVWRDDIARAIAEANGVVFVVSPDSLVSVECGTEARIAREQGKRIVPVVARASDPDAAPPEIGELNWRISFTGDGLFEDGLARLVEALDTDLDWVREHTRYQGAAGTWDGSGRDRSFLLRGNELAAAERWLAGQAGKEPPPTELQSAFLLASRSATTRRQRTLVIALTAGLAAAVGLSVFAFVQRQSAIDREQTAKARELATNAVSQLDRDPALAVTLAAEAVRTRREPQIVDVLRQALAGSGERVVIDGDDGLYTSAVATSPDGTRLLGGGNDGSRVWALPSGRPLRTLDRRPASGVAFARNGTLLVTMAQSRTRIWPASGARPGRTVDGGYFDASFDADARLVAVRTARRIELRRVDSGELVATLPFRTDYRAVLSPDGALVAVPTDRDVRVWSWGARRPSSVIPADYLPYRSVFAPDSRSIAVVAADGSVVIWRVPKRKRLATLRGHTGGIAAIAFSGDGRLVATAGRDGTARVWDAVTGAPVRVLRGHEGRVNEDGVDRTIGDVALSGDGAVAATTGQDDTTRVWATWPVPRVALLVQRAGGLVTEASFSRDGSRLVTANVDGTARVWKIAPSRQVAVLAPVPGRDAPGAEGAAFGPDGTIALSTGSGVTLWHGTTKTATFPVLGSNEAEFSPDGRLVAYVDGDLVRVRDVESRERVGTIHAGRNEPVMALDFDPAGDLIATAAQNSRVALWKPNGTKVWVFRGHVASVYDVAFSPDGKLLASAGSDGTVRLWNVDARRPDRVFSPGGQVTSVDFSADGRYVAYSTFDTTGVYELATRTTILTLPGSRARFAPTGHRLATVVGGDVAVWDCEVCGTPDELLALADARDVRPLTADERRTFLHE